MSKRNTYKLKNTVFNLYIKIKFSIKKYSNTIIFLALYSILLEEYMTRAWGETATYKHILTINQVFDILLQYHESGSWVSALHRNIPPKTGFVLKKEYSEEISKLQRNKESFSCSECGKQFAFRSILERHIIKHKDQIWRLRKRFWWWRNRF